MFKYSVVEKFDLHFKPFTKKNFHFLVIVESAASQRCFSGPDKRSVTSIRYQVPPSNRPRPSVALAVQTSDLLRVSVTSATFCRDKDTSVTQAGKLYRKPFVQLLSFPVWPYIAVYRLLELLQCVKIDISNEFLVLPVGL